MFVALTSLATAECGMAKSPCTLTTECCEAHACTDGACRRTGPEPSSDEYLDRLAEFYAKVRETRQDFALPSRTEAADTLRKWADKEELLFHVMRDRYGLKEEL